MGYGLEVDLVALAHAKDMLTTPYVFNIDEAAAMTGPAPTLSSRIWD